MELVIQAMAINVLAVTEQVINLRGVLVAGALVVEGNVIPAVGGDLKYVLVVTVVVI